MISQDDKIKSARQFGEDDAIKTRHYLNSAEIDEPIEPLLFSDMDDDWDGYLTTHLDFEQNRQTKEAYIEGYNVWARR